MRLNKKRYKRVIDKSDEGDNNWLISYADLMTLLWGFFVILSAFSVPSQSLLEKLKESTARSMGGTYEKPFNEITDELLKVLKEMNLTNESKIDNLSDGVKLTIKSGYFFDSGSAVLNKEAEKVLRKIGEVLKSEETNFKIFVEGHTDDLPMNSLDTPSNWELSAKRAATVVRLFESSGVEHSILRPIGLADVDPLIAMNSVSSSEYAMARAKNRRIVIRLQKVLPSRKKGVRLE